jgi:Flp pilus assembly protein TadD
VPTEQLDLLAFEQRAAQGEQALAAGELDQAIAHARQALASHRRSGHRPGHARALVLLGQALDRAGDADAAQSCWQEALALFTAIRSPDADQVRTLLDGCRRGSVSQR